MTSPGEVPDPLERIAGADLPCEEGPEGGSLGGTAGEDGKGGLVRLVPQPDAPPGA